MGPGTYTLDEARAAAQRVLYHGPTAVSTRAIRVLASHVVHVMAQPPATPAGATSQLSPELFHALTAAIALWRAWGERPDPLLFQHFSPGAREFGAAFDALKTSFEKEFNDGHRD
jgi:hypothetical protein